MQNLHDMNIRKYQGTFAAAKDSTLDNKSVSEKDEIVETDKI